MLWSLNNKHVFFPKGYHAVVLGSCHHGRVKMFKNTLYLKKISLMQASLLCTCVFDFSPAACIHTDVIYLT
jgi:hypothetical protein